MLVVEVPVISCINNLGNISMPSLILGSTSPARKELLKRLRIPFQVIAPEVEEKQLPGESATDMAMRLAIAKAQAVAQRITEGVIIGCDQVITLNGEIFGKPGDHQHAVEQLTKMSGQQVISLTAMCLLNVQTKKLQTTIERYDVYFRSLSPALIEQYLIADQPYQCAGSIKAESLGAVLFERLAGDDPSALTGLPLIKLVRFLENEGIHVL